MLLCSKQTKFLKSHIILNVSDFSLFNENLIFGSYGLVALKSGYLYPEELESVRRVIVRTFRFVIKVWKIPKVISKVLLKVWFRVFAFHSLTKKPNEVRMGKGKGEHSCWVYPVRKGKIILELTIFPMYALKLLIEICSKLNVTCKIVYKTF